MQVPWIRYMLHTVATDKHEQFFTDYTHTAMNSLRMLLQDTEELIITHNSHSNLYQYW